MAFEISKHRFPSAQQRKIISYVDKMIDYHEGGSITLFSSQYQQLLNAVPEQFQSSGICYKGILLERGAHG